MFKRKEIRLNNKLKKIRLISMDFDGVLTDSGIYLSNDELTFRKFNIKDGMGIKILQNKSINIAIISGSNSKIIDKRANQLGINIIKKGIKNKANSIKEIQDLLKINKEETLFLGDDINDLTVLPFVDLFFTPNDGHNSCKKVASYIGKFKGGEGFIREIADKILLAKGENPYQSFQSRNDFSD